ncbi:MAG: right-handed parallel beta-helix repeat-containing protein [Candidatus Delongbacteria bacterium]|nr:right-handed parallel beta-helix repeat-containing protein [Candidatus Delongbacteria bacterium]
MRILEKVVILFIMVIVSVIYAGQLGPWSHFKAIDFNMTINYGDTLTINSGTEVRFSPSGSLTINGVIKSNGTSSDPVIFGALSATDPTWDGVNISNTDPLQVSTFNSTIFTKMYSTNGNGPININESSVDFINCRFFDNHADFNGGAVYVVAGNVNFTACVFRDNNAENGGGLYIYNNPSASQSSINLNYCSFVANRASNGGGLYVEDYDGAMYDMLLNIQNTGFNYNKATSLGGFGGGLFINVLSHLDLKFKLCKIQFNDAFVSGGGIYAKFNEMYGQPVLSQEFSNLLITKNSAMDGGGFYLNTGLTINPVNINIINTTIADNYILPGKTSKEYGGGGIHIVSNDNYPFIKNSIIWNNGNEYYLDQYLISDDTFPSPGAIFSYCNINDYVEGQGNISSNPRFVRPPLLFTGDNTLTFAADRYDYHLSLNSPCIDAGDPATPIDPMATPELNYPPVNMGAYGNTKQAAVPLSSLTPIVAGTVTDLNIPDGGVVVLDFEGKAQAFDYDLINLGEGSQLHFNAVNLATINIKELRTPIQPAGKYFNDERIVIQKINDGIDVTNKTLNISNIAQLHGVELSDIHLTVFDPLGGTPTVNIANSKIYNSDSELLSSGISVTDAATIDIINTNVDNFKTGIEVTGGTKESKASGRITNNTVTFDADASKAGQQVGVKVQNANGMDIEDNDIENGDIGIQMSNSTGGRITNNTVTFDADASKNGKLLGKIAIDINSGTDTVVEDNEIWIADSLSSVVSGINVESSSAQIFYNKINFVKSGILVRNGIVFNDVQSGTYAYNNTIFNATNGVNNTPGSYSVDFINNIIWNDGTRSAGVNNPDSLNFYNNDIEDLSGISGVDNISSDPLCIDPLTNDLVIGTSSPCMNTGMIISGFHIADSTYYGIAPEIGYMEYYEISLSAPENPTVSVTDSTFSFGWSVVSGATSYTIYSSDDPYAVFDSVATVVTTSWETSIATPKKFFFVIANDASKNVTISDEPFSYEEAINDKKNKVIKKSIPKKIKRTSSSR